jgi:outer membrane protein OmpA-like peptidoglycan-associated protein
MNAAKSLGRLILLLVLLTIGVLLILHIGRSLTPPNPEPDSTPRAANTKVGSAPVIPPVAAPVPPPGPSNRLVVPRGAIAGIVNTARGRFISTEPILFNSGLSILREASIPKLNMIAGFLVRNPHIKVNIIGHTDNLGIESVNQRISAERAALVLAYLISQGIDPSRLTSKGMGSLDPIETNDTQLGRQANRRIEFLIREEAPLAPPKE